MLSWVKANLGWFACSILTGFLWFALFPPLNWRFLAPIFLLPLLWAISQMADWRQRFLVSWIGGIIFWALICEWIRYVLEVHGAMGRWGSLGTFALFCMAKALHLGVFGAIGGWILRQPWALIGIPALWTVLDYTHSFLGFQWLMPGNSAIEMAMPMRLAPITGVYGVTFVLVLLSTAAVLALLGRPRWQLVPILGLAGILLLPALPDPVAPNASVAAIQPNQPPDSAATYQDVLAENQRFAAQSILISKGADLIAWPESPQSMRYDSDGEFRALLAAAATKSGLPVIAGTVLSKADEQITNSAVAVDRDGRLAGSYDKVNLVPFGEFVPPLFGFVNRITSEAGIFVPGKKMVLLPVGKHRAATIICYESVFPHHVRELVVQGAAVILNLSNDGYFGGSAAADQHLLIAQMRAAENAKWLVRVTNSGITATIDPAGRVAATLPRDTATSGQLPFSFLSGGSFYSRAGDWFVGVCALVLLAGTAADWRRRLARTETSKALN
jgi:apolipoprotein N-acyltransferase